MLHVLSSATSVATEKNFIYENVLSQNLTSFCFIFSRYSRDTKQIMMMSLMCLIMRYEMQKV